MLRPRGFTLVELLTVISIIGILSAMLMPAAMAARTLAYQYSAAQSLGQLAMASSMYAGDQDESFMPALYATGDGLQCWFGRRSPDGSFRTQLSLLAPYTGRKRLADSTFQAKPFLGDKSGFGYNWAFLGSDFGVVGNLAGFPNCINEARLSDLSAPSKNIEFATSSLYFAKWLPKGDGGTYDYGFIDAPMYWHGDPDIDFRFGGTRMPDPSTEHVYSEGSAPVAYSDGHTAARRQSQILDENFTR